MSRTDEDLPPRSDDRSVLGCRVSDDVQSRFSKFVDENLPNRRGAYGYAVEKAMIEYMDNDRYERVERRLKDLTDTTHQTNALVRQLITAEKEKGAFLEPEAPLGNQAGDRVKREGAVIAWLAERIAGGEIDRTFTEATFNEAITEAAGVSSDPTKRDYRESLMERSLVEPGYGKYSLTEKAFEMAGFEVSGGGRA